MLFSFENIYRQYLNCRRNKRNTINALRFEINQEQNLIELKEALETRTYKPSRSVCFFATRPKLREIFAADFRDRIVHHILVDYLERIWEPVFIHDSYACRRGKGIHRGVLRLQQFIRKVTKNGIDFLGYIVRPDYLLVRRRVVNNLQVKLREYKALLVKEGRFYRRYLFDEEMLDRLSAVLSSYLGHFKMANTYNLCKSIWERYNFLDEYFDFDPKAKKLVRKYRHPQGFRKTYQQYLYYRSRFKGDILFFQVGRFFEFYHFHDKEVAHTLSLTVLRKNKRQARYGFPINLMNNYLQKLFRMKMPITLIFEKERYLTGIKERAPGYRYEWMGTRS